MLPLWTPLWFDLQYSSPSLLLIVGIFFTATAIVSRLFANQVIMDHPSVKIIDPKPSIAQDMNVLRNPFTLVLDDIQDRDEQLTNGVTVKITGDKAFRFSSYWGVNITAFHRSLKQDWKEIRAEIRENTFLSEHCLQSTRSEAVYPSIGETITRQVKPVDPLTPEMLGTSPRSCYPLITVLSINDDHLDTEDSQRTTADVGPSSSSTRSDAGDKKRNDEIVCLISVIHIRDNVCPMDSNIINQFTKLRHGNVYSLQSLFTPGATVDETSKPVTMCVICQDNTISRALLPCRHACICCECYSLIDKCPLCRSYIHTFFFIQGHVPEKTAEQPADPSPSDERTKTPTRTRKRFGFLSFF